MRSTGTGERPLLSAPTEKPARRQRHTQPKADTQKHKALKNESPDPNSTGLSDAVGFKYPLPMQVDMSAFQNCNLTQKLMKSVHTVYSPA